MAPVASGILTGAGIFLIFLQCFNYIVDCYPSLYDCATHPPLPWHDFTELTTSTERLPQLLQTPYCGLPLAVHFHFSQDR